MLCDDSMTRMIASCRGLLDTRSTNSEDLALPSRQCRRRGGGALSFRSESSWGSHAHNCHLVSPGTFSDFNRGICLKDTCKETSKCLENVLLTYSLLVGKSFVYHKHLEPFRRINRSSFCYV